jgi:O-antigen/teichoic acid export membrane protein
MTSLVGKGASTLVQVFAMPVAIAALGVERFGAYAVLAAILTWVGIASVAIIPGVTVQLVRAGAMGNRALEKEIVGSAALIAIVGSVMLSGLLLLALNVFGLKRIFGAAFADYVPELSQGMLPLLVFVGVNLMLSVAEGVQAGYQKLYVHNLFGAIGSLVTVLAIFLVVRHSPTIANLAIAVYSAPVIARALSLLQVLWSRPYLTGSIRFANLRTMRSLVSTGASFFTTNLGTLVYQAFSVYWVGRTWGPAAAAEMSVFVIMMNVSGSVLLMFTQPLWPAIQDAVVRNDLPWIHRAYASGVRHLGLYFGAAALALALAGNWLFGIWLKEAIAVDRITQATLAVYFLLVAWEHFNYSFLIGLARFWLTSLAFLAGALVAFGNGLWLVPLLGVEGMLLALCSGPLAVTVWMYPVLLRRQLRRAQ